jgi:hypothetical protein
MDTRDAHEANVTQVMAGLNAGFREELLHLMGFPPRVENVPEAFWERVQERTEDELTAVLIVIFLAATMQGGFAPMVPYDAAEGWASDHAAEVAEGYADHSQEEFAELAEEWGPRPSLSEVRAGIGEIFSAERAEMVGITETGRAITAGGEELFGANDDDVWVVQPDCCDVCDELDGEPRSVWSLKFPQGPPAHPNCRCDIDWANDEAG